MTTLAGKVALVTGASKGIGAGIATAFGAAAAEVAVGYAPDREGAERIASEIQAAGGKAITVQGDLAKTADIEAMIAEAVARLGPIDILVTARRTARADELREHLDHASRADAAADIDREALARVFVDDGEALQRLSARARIEHEVVGSHLVGSVRSQRTRATRRDSTPWPSPRHL